LPIDINLELRELRPGDRVTGLSIGEPVFLPLKTYLQKEAKSHHRLDLAKTYAFIEPSAPPRVRGYITLVCGEIVVEDGAPQVEPDANFTYPHFPAVKIARLIVDSRLRGNDLGTKLVQLGLGIVKDQICPRVGCRFVVVDAKRESLDFYVDCGFTLLNTKANRDRAQPIMFVDMTKVPSG
jgi:hypothetical protein